MNKDNAFFCPACGSPSLETSNLAGGDASCKACFWTGKREELVQVSLEHSFLSQEDMLVRFIKQLSTVIANTSAQPVGRVLMQWGFLDADNSEVMQAQLKAYIKVMALAATKVVIETRQHLERARVNKTRKHVS